MKDATISELYDLTQTIAAKIFEGKTYPWEVLPLIKDFILELGETLDPAEYEKRGENVWIAKDAVIAPTASINGPCIIGKGAETPSSVPLSAETPSSAKALSLETPPN